MTMTRLTAALMLLLMAPALMLGADNLRLNPHLNYKRNNRQGPLITGSDMEGGTMPGVVNYIIFYEEFCYNAKRQARTTVNLYRQYKGRVHFVIVDFEYGWSAAQDKLVRKYFMSGGNRDFPQIVILDAKGRPVFDYVGQTPQARLEMWLNAALEYPDRLPEVDHVMDHPAPVHTHATTHNPLAILKDRLTR